MEEAAIYYASYASVMEMVHRWTALGGDLPRYLVTGMIRYQDCRVLGLVMKFSQDAVGTALLLYCIN